MLGQPFPQASHRALVVLGCHVQADLHGDLDRLRVTSLDLAPVFQRSLLLAKARRIDVRDVPAVGVTCRDASGAPLASSTDPERQAVLHRLRQDARLTELDPPSVERDRVLLEETTQGLDTLFELIQPLAVGKERIPESAVFRLVPASTQTDLETATAQVVDGDDRLGQQPDVAELHGEHHATKADALCLTGDRREEGHGLEVRNAIRGAGVEMIPHREPIEPLFIGEPPQAAQFLDGRVLRADVNPEPHGALPSFRSPLVATDSSLPRQGSGEECPAG
ncbi:hypothetical protein HRbin27_01665 [bacterium HR27]|nr:hypothetical protein HRbin27_01665 [bacterium HR27]